jgi:guanylate kinase
MKYIVFTGTTGAGKDELISYVLSKAKSKYPEKLEKAWYYTTQNPGERPGEASYDRFITDEKFNQLNGENLIFAAAQNSHYQVGYPLLESKADKVTILNINPKGARELKQKAELLGGKVLMIYLDAPKQQRVERIRFRDNQLLYEPVEEKVDLDVVKGGAEAHKDYDLIVENKDGDLERTKDIVWGKIEEFLKEIYGETKA